MLTRNNFVNAGLLFLVAMLFFVFVSDDSEAATYTVDKFGGSDYTNITQAVDNASAGDTIRVASRNYHDAVEVDKKLTIIGGNYGIEMGNLYDCNNGDLVAKYSLDEEDPSEVDDGVWCHDNNGDVEGASTEAGVWDNGLDFDGSNDYVEIDDASVFDSDVISISAWVNLDDNDTGIRTIFSKYESDSDSVKGYTTLIDENAKFKFVFGMGSSSGACESVKEIPENTWKLLTATYDKSSIKLYIDGELDNSCNYSNSISDTSNKQIIGASDHNNDGNYDDFFDGTLDEVTIWDDALTSSDIEKIYWGGDFVRPVVNASGGDYVFKLAAAKSQLKYFEVQYSGSTTGESTGDAGVLITADEVQLHDNLFRYNTFGVRIVSSDDVQLHYTFMHCDYSSLDRGIISYSSDNLLVYGGDFHCADEFGIVILYGEGNIFDNINLQYNDIGIKAAYTKNSYFNNSYFNDNTNVGLLLFGADNNTIYNSDFNSEKYAISFTREAENNTIKDVDFSNTDSYDIHHGYDSNSNRNGWNNVIIDTDFDDLYIDSDSELIEKEEVEISVTSNGTYVWNRVNTTIDSDRKANSGVNSFWVGDGEEGTYLDSWLGSFKQKSDISLPSGGVGETRLLEIKTWYETEDRFDGGQVYITKNSGSTWQLLTPIGGYDNSFTGDCGSTQAFMGDKSSLGWQTKRFNLTDYRGEDIRLKFTFCSDSSEHDFEGWYVDDIKIIKASDESVVTYSEGFERIGYRWVAQNEAGAVNWEPEGTQIYTGINNADVYVADGNSAAIIMNKTSNQNLVNYYKFDETSCCNAYDTVTPSHSAYLYSGASFVSGKFGNAVNFDGSNDYARNSNCNTVGSCNGYDHYSMSVWVKFDSFPTGTAYEGIANFRYDADAYLAVNSDGNPVFGAFFWGTPYGDQKIEASTEMVTDVWYHIVGTWSEDSDKLRIYVNGTLDGTNTFSGTTAYMRYSQSYNWIGRCAASSTSCNGGYMDGMVDNLAIFNSELSSSQAMALYQDPLGTNSILYKTSHFGGSDSKTNSQGKIDSLLIIKKIYAGSSSGTNYKPHIGFHKGSWTEDPREVTISGGEHSGKLPDSRVYNRNKGELYYSISEAVSDASAQNVIELWPGHYKENVYINKRLSIIGSGPSRTIVNGRYLESPFTFDTNSDNSVIKNLAVINSKNTTTCCSTSSSSAGIETYYSYDMVIDNIRADSYIGIMAYYSNNLVIKNSEIVSTSTTHYYGIRLYNYQDYTITNNEIANYRDGVRIEYMFQGLDFKDNYVHNNTNYGIYTYYSANSLARSNPFTIENNRFVDNQYGIYKSDTSSSYGYSFHIKDNLFKSSTWDGIFGNYYSREWIIENNTFEGDNDQRYGINFNRYSYKNIIGNNTFSGHTTKDLYFYYCYCTGTNAVKFFNNSFSSIYNNNGLINVYRNLNIRTVDEDDNAFSNVDLEIKDSLSTYYKTSHWGGNDALTDALGYISSAKYFRTGYYSNSDTLTENTITVKIAHGVRAKTSSFTFDSDSTKKIEVPNNFKQGVIENKETETLYSSFSSAV
ncbi:MAG: LamG-like jellyroll fold domain-containing protein, partial [Candidatus Thermoplasmatota archaeon]|nr:LamG-like jellyroll fold domain-containing protein [Candidatus Thermoplasmatota archaeon]